MKKMVRRMTDSTRTGAYGFLWHASLRMLWRDWRGGELGILAIGLVIAVTSITAVGFFTDRLERGLQLQSAELIGADFVITSARAGVADHIEAARAHNLNVVMTQQFRSVISTGERPQLVEVKSVAEGYPLRGTLRISDAPFGADVATAGIPASGDIWVEARLLQLLGLVVGDRVSLGVSEFTVRKVLRYEPDRAGEMFSIAPRVLMNQADLDATGLIGVGALVSYRVLIAGPRQSIAIFRDNIVDSLQPGEQTLSVEDGRPELNRALEKARQFLGLAALISVMLAGVAVATVAYRFTERHLDTAAMLRCLGASQSVIIRLFVMELLWLSLLASSIGCGLGWLAQFVITGLLDQLVVTQLPPASWRALLPGYATGVVMLVGFAIPPLLSLRRVPPLRVLRKDVQVNLVNRWLVYLAVVLCMFGLLYWQIGDLKLVATVLGGITATLVLLALAAWLLIVLLNRLRGRVGVAWRFGLANISRRPASSVTQIVAFGLGIMVMLLLSTVRSDLLDDWQQSLPPEAPNHFVINVQPDQVDGVVDYFESRGVKGTRLYPMVRARLLEINGKPARTTDYESERARHMITREFNLSWAKQMQVDNTLVAGSWWNSEDYGKPLLSLEAKLAETLGLQTGDVLGFDVNGTQMDFTISSLRQVVWDNFNINFFTVVAPGVLEGEPASWVTSVFLDEARQRQLGELVREYPNVTLIDVGIIMQRVRGIMERVLLAIEFVFLFTIAAGVAVLYAAIQANRDQRRFESAVLRTLGARKSTLLTGLFAEFATLGALAGLLAGVSATGLAWLLAETVFRFEYQLDVSIVLTGLATGISIVVIAGLLGTRSVLTQPPIRSLREGAA
jgi:putative ABC transport system permease protein